MYGYIIPDVIQKDMEAVRKYNEKSKIIFGMETDSNPDRYEANPTVTPDGRTRDTTTGKINLGTSPVSFPNDPTPPVYTSLNDLPTSDPLVAGVIWNNGGVPTISNG